MLQIKQIKDSLKIITKVCQRPERKQFNPLVEVPTTFYDAQINDLICETTNSEKSSEEVNSSIGMHMNYELS